MRYDFAEAPSEGEKDKILATALNGVVYTENGRLHIKGNGAHYVYKYEGDPAGWYARNVKTLDDFYLGAGACPSLTLEGLDVKDEAGWQSVLRAESGEVNALAAKIEEAKNGGAAGTAQ